MKLKLLVLLAFLLLPINALLAQEDVIMVLIRERTALQEQAQTIQSIIIRAEERGVTDIVIGNNSSEISGTIYYVSRDQSTSTGIAFGRYTLAAMRAELERRNNRIPQLTNEIALMMQVMQNQSKVQQQGQIFN